MTYVSGLVVVAASCVWMWFLTQNTAMQVFGAAVLLGIGTSTILITSLAMTADLIGENTVNLHVYQVYSIKKQIFLIYYVMTV